jgi:hypothetical protein
MERQHTNSYGERRGTIKRPVVIIQMRAIRGDTRFCARILEARGAPYSIRD